MEFVRSFPGWFRWLLLLPASLGGGFIVGYSVYLINASQAARPDAPIVFIADFLGGLFSNLAAFYIAHEIAPSHQRTVLIVYVTIALIAGIATTYIVLSHEHYRNLPGVGGNLVACYIAWRKFVSPVRA
ncbi:MAG: hypothetical protein A3G24_09630 [Betaproteobacteria bacterium RIFCSPLOWO2_12_FULL_62_13]|nr:MAG: hypothetical protein A3G24_09630 [Betaproteobacteria bacterium RIFCSPLOWO2_12_FULL_62_13]